MPRIARPVFAGAPHCSARLPVFFDEADRVAYLAWLGEYCAKDKVKVLAYCLISNHVHGAAVPGSDQALERVFRPLHTRYAQRVNRAKRWQGRFFSSALDDTYVWAAIRNVERNPARTEGTAGRELPMVECGGPLWSEEGSRAHDRQGVVGSVQRRG